MLLDRDDTHPGSGAGSTRRSRTPPPRQGSTERVTVAGGEAIGWIVAPAEGVEAPRWSVTFAVDDPDAVAARATQLGGTVVVEPYDAAPVRIAVLRDPQGAQFTISAYDPAR